MTINEGIKAATGKICDYLNVISVDDVAVVEQIICDHVCPSVSEEVNIIKELEAENARLRELLKMSLGYINTPHACYASGGTLCLLAQVISAVLAGGEGK